ncbi:hypothetical protein ABZ446_03770 [Streptomyces sp. NPDC005813]|uniref:hypothetical protein n=1 Tax=Streptomyces sp. NPDC005813 TaxID=3155592 RepID=UPI0033D6CB64
MAQRGGCMLNGCLAVLMTALVLVLFGMWRLSTAPGRADDRARHTMEESVDRSRDRLSRAAGDGALLGTEIDRTLGTGNGRADAPEVRRRGRRVTVTARFAQQGSGWFAGSTRGCYRFEVVPASAPPPVSVHELPYTACREPVSPPAPRSPAAVAADVVVELRAALARGGFMAVQTAEVWQTYGVHLVDQKVADGQLSDLVLLSAGANEQVCYEFRARRETDTVTSEQSTMDDCRRFEREREKQAEKEERALLDASSAAIAGRLDHAVADGRLPDAELRRAFAMQQTDEGKELWHDSPVAVPVSVERSPAEVIVYASVNPLDSLHTALGCYEFRVHLTKHSVTRRRTAGTECFA